MSKFASQSGRLEQEYEERNCKRSLTEIAVDKCGIKLCPLTRENSCIIIKVEKKSTAILSRVRSFHLMSYSLAGASAALGGVPVGEGADQPDDHRPRTQLQARASPRSGEFVLIELSECVQLPSIEVWIKVAERCSFLCKVYRLVQPNFTPEVFYSLYARTLSISSMTSLKHHMEYFNVRC